MKSYKVVISAGELSADHYSAALVRCLREKIKDIEIVGMGLDSMRQAGVDLLVHARELSVMGFSDILPRLHNYIVALQKMKAALRGADLLILVDFPDFNFRLAKAAKKLGIPVLYYVSPQLWAWRSGRAKIIKKIVDKMVVILPFEKEFYKHYGIDTDFVGHPIVEKVYNETRGLDIPGMIKRYNIDPEKKVITLLPGSRRGEVSRILPVLAKAAALVDSYTGENHQYIILKAKHLPWSLFDIKIDDNLSIKVIEDDFYSVIDISYIAIAASGTVTIEVALMKKPMVVVYRLSAINYLLGRIFIKVPFICLVNLIAQEKVVPELIQKDADPGNVAKEVTQLLKDRDRYRMIQAKIVKVAEKLGPPGASVRTANIAIELLDNKK